jgi:hypothetical protein
MTYKINQIETASKATFPNTSQNIQAFVWARDKIARRTQQKNNIPLFYRESLRFLIGKLNTLKYINSENEVLGVKCIHANPERTIGKLKQENNIILPIISINQDSSQNSDNRRRTSINVVSESWWSDEKKRAFRVLSIAPRAVDIEYGINIWAKYKSNLDQLVEQIRLMFNPDLVIENSYTNTALSFIDQEVDNSTLETSDRQERIIRRSFKIKVEAYIPNPKFLITSTGEIEEFNVDTTLY